MEYKKEDLNHLARIENDYINNSLPDDNADSFSEVVTREDEWLLDVLHLESVIRPSS